MRAVLTIALSTILFGCASFDIHQAELACHSDKLKKFEHVERGSRRIVECK